MLYCKDVTLFWKIICNLIFNPFQKEIQIDQKIIVVGMDIGNQFINVTLRRLLMVLFTTHIICSLNSSRC